VPCPTGSFRRPTIVKRSTKVVLLVGLILSAIYAWPVRPFILGMRQIRSIADGRSIAASLDQFRERHGVYPTHLAEALPANWKNLRDPWGHPWVYITDGSAFLLLSFGKDGIPDRNDYRLPLHSERVIFVKTCGQWNRDQIISNLDVHQGCGK
jgi:Type II secretion system (T2SS), protein G